MYVLLKVNCPVGRVLHGMDGEVPRSGILLDLSTEGALEPDVAGSFVVRVVRGRVGPEVESMSSSVPGVRYQLPEQSMAALCIGSMLATSARVCGGSGTAA